MRFEHRHESLARPLRKQRRCLIGDPLIEHDPAAHARRLGERALAHVDARFVLAHEALAVGIDVDLPRRTLLRRHERHIGPDGAPAARRIFDRAQHRLPVRRVAHRCADRQCAVDAVACGCLGGDGAERCTVMQARERFSVTSITARCEHDGACGNHRCSRGKRIAAQAGTNNGAALVLHQRFQGGAKAQLQARSRPRRLEQPRQHGKHRSTAIDTPVGARRAIGLVQMKDRRALRGHREAVVAQPVDGLRRQVDRLAHQCEVGGAARDPHDVLVVAIG